MSSDNSYKIVDLRTREPVGLIRCASHTAAEQDSSARYPDIRTCAVYVPSALEVLENRQARTASGRRRRDKGRKR